MHLFFLIDRGPCSLGKGFGFWKNQHQWSGARRAVPHFTFMVQLLQGFRHREEPCWSHGTGYGSDREVQKQVLSWAQGWGGLSCSRALPCAWWELPGISVSCSPAGPEPSRSDNCWPLVLSGITTPLWVIQISDCLQRKWRLVCVCGSSDEAMPISQVRQQPTPYTSSPGTCAPGQHWVVGQVPFSSIHAPLPCPQDTCGFDEGTMRTSAFSFPLRLHFYLNFSAFDFQSLVLVIRQD